MQKPFAKTSILNLSGEVLLYSGRRLAADPARALLQAFDSGGAGLLRGPGRQGGQEPSCALLSHTVDE